MIEAVETCILTHKLFTTLGEVAFRRSSADGMPVMTIAMGEREACIPIRSLQREFQIDDASEDGRMLDLVGQSLDFVCTLRPGDRLPAEVLGSGASWSPAASHREIAATRLQRQLVAWLARAGGDVDSIGDDARMRSHLNQAIGAAAEALDVNGPAQVIDLIAAMADELAYIEALRETLLQRVEAMVRKVTQLGVTRARDAVHHETLGQVTRLSELARRQLRDRFAELDAQTGEIMSVLRNVERQRAFVRSNRDWLYRTSRAWAPILDEWARSGLVPDEFVWALMTRTYQFLAPRYMPVTEWQSAARRAPQKALPMAW